MAKPMHTSGVVHGLASYTQQTTGSCSTENGRLLETHDNPFRHRRSCSRARPVLPLVVQRCISTSVDAAHMPRSTAIPIISPICRPRWIRKLVNRKDSKWCRFILRNTWLGVTEDRDQARVRRLPLSYAPWQVEDSSWNGLRHLMYLL